MHNQVSRPLVLALDVGTSGMRAALYDESARELEGTQARSPSHIITTTEGGAELNAEGALEQLALTIDRTLALAPTASLIETVAVSCFWHSLVGVDDEGNAVTSVLTWADTRSAHAAEELRSRLDEGSVHVRTGAPFHPSYWPAKLLWFSRSQTEIYKSVSRWMSFSDFLALKLFGRARSSVSMASATGLFNIKTCEWDEELCGELNLSKAQLPTLTETDRAFDLLQGEYARRWPQLSRARWFPAIGDGAANNIGAGCTSPDSIALMIGTSGAVRVLFEGAPPVIFPRGLWCYRADRRRVVVGGALSDGGGLWAWMNESLRLHKRAETEMELSALEPDSHGLTVMPFWAGERSTGWNGFARGAILGLSMHTRPFEILRASMESVAFRFAQIMEALEEFAPGARVIASGGALHASHVWAQIVADVLGRPLIISGAEESSSRGAVLLALEASDKIKSICTESAQTERIVEPDMIHHALYRKARERHDKLYLRLVADEETARLINTSGTSENRKPSG